MYYYSLKFRCDHTHTRPVTSRKKHRLPASTDLNTTERDRASVEPRYKPIFERIRRMVWGRPALRTDFRANSPHGVGVDPRYEPIFERIRRMVLGSTRVTNRFSSESTAWCWARARQARTRRPSGRRSADESPPRWSTRSRRDRKVAGSRRATSGCVI